MVRSTTLPLAKSVGCWTSGQEVAGAIPGLGQHLFRIDYSHCDRIHSSLTTVHCFDGGYVGKQLVGLEIILYGVLVKRNQGKHG